jgi:hypothetical protein
MICEFSHGITKSIQSKVLRKFLENVGIFFTFVRDIWTGRKHEGVVPTELDVCVSITNEGKETFTQKTE